MKKFIMAVMVLALLISGGVVAYKTGLLSHYLPILLNSFQSQTEEGVIAVSGNVEITEVNIGFTLSGRIQELFAPEGQTVQAGQVLARLENAELQRIPNTLVTLDDDSFGKVMKLIEALEDDDDVQKVFHNLDITEEQMELI